MGHIEIMMGYLPASKPLCLLLCNPDTVLLSIQSLLYFPRIVGETGKDLLSNQKHKCAAFTAPVVPLNNKDFLPLMRA